MSEGFVEIDGLRLHLETHGSGPPLLLLHGFTGAAESFADLRPALAHSFRCIVPDLVGHGSSGAPESLARYRMERCVADLCALLDALATGPVHVLGYSMGGRVALSLCAAFPERVKSAVLVGASAGIEDPAARAARQRSDETLAQRIEREGVPAFVEQWSRLPLFASQETRLAPEQRARQERQRLRNRAGGLARSLRGMGSGAQPPLHALLPHIGTPLLLLAGADDAKFRAIARDLARRLPNAAVEIVPEAGHAAHLESPEAVAQSARRFFTAGAEPRPLQPTRTATREVSP